MKTRSFGLVLGLMGLAMLTACKSSDLKPAATPCEGVEGAATTGLRTGVEGAATGLQTGYAGVKQVGGATAGLVENGKSGAESRWDEGKAETKAVAHEGAAKTKQEAQRCR